MFAVCVSRDPDPGLNKGVAKALYPLLVSYADVSSRDTSRGYPYRAALAGCLDCSKQTVDRAASYLEHEIGLVRIHRRKVEGKADENDANIYEIFDAWLIHGVPAPAGTPPQLVARYGHTIPGFDIDAWMAEHAPDYDLEGWRATYDARVREQQARRAEQQKKENVRRRKPAKKGGQDRGGVTGDATPVGEASEGGDVVGDATRGVMGDVSDGVVGDALSTPLTPEPSSTRRTGVTAAGPGAGGFTPASARTSAAAKTPTVAGGFAAVRKRRSTAVTGLVPVPGEDDVYAALDALGILTSPAHRIPTLRRSVREFLGHPGAEVRDRASFLYPRTAEHAVTRINAGWYRAQGPARSHSSYVGCRQCTPSGCVASREDCDRIVRPVGYLQALLDAQDCENPHCERGILLDDGKECRLCEYRAAELIVAARGRVLAAELEVDRTSWPGETAKRLAAEPVADRDAGLPPDARDNHDVAAQSAYASGTLTAVSARPEPQAHRALRSQESADGPELNDRGPDAGKPPAEQEREQLVSLPSAEYRRWREQQGRAKSALFER
ncbi:hypothetical protein [Streptomyces sp. NPDC054952]